MAKKAVPAAYAGAEPSPPVKNSKGKKLPAFLQKAKAGGKPAAGKAKKPPPKSKGKSRR